MCPQEKIKLELDFPLGLIWVKLIETSLISSHTLLETGLFIKNCSFLEKIKLELDFPLGLIWG
jgi:hypothetical protein